MNVPLRSPAGPVPGGRPPVPLPEKSRRFARAGKSLRSAGLALAALLGSQAFAATYTWDFSAATPAETIPNLTPAPTVIQYNNNGTTPLLSTTSPSSGYAGATGTNNAGAAARTLALNTASGGSAAFEFAITPASGFQFALTDISFGSRSTGTGPQAYTLRSSADGYVADIATGTLSANSAWALKSNTGLTFTANTATTFRLFGYNGAGSPGAGTANWRVDDLIVTVTVTSTGADTTPPAIQTLLPANAATGVALASNLAVTFNESVVAIAGGTITLKKADNSTVESFTLPSAAVNVNGATVTINPTADLLPSTGYYVEINGVALEDTAGNNFAGYTGNSTWSFTTVAPDTTGPVVTGIDPANNATGVALNVTPVLSYDENVNNGTGSVFIKNAANVTVVTLDATDSAQVTTSNSPTSHTVSLTIPPGALSANTQYYVQMPAGAVKDDLGNNSPAFGSLATSNFTTKPLPVLTTGTPYTQDFTSFTSATNLTDASSLLPQGWSISGSDLTYDGDWGTGTTGGFRGGSAGILGYQHTGSTGTLVETLTLVNGNATPITDLVIGYTGKRTLGTATPPVERYPAFIVKVGETVIPALAYARTEGDSVVKLAGVTGLSIPANATFTISWTSDRDLLGSGASRQVGVDDVSVSVGTLSAPPTVTGPFVTIGSLTDTSMEVNAETTADGGAAVTAMGFVYSVTATNASPTIGGAGVTNVPFATPGISTFVAPISGLAPETAYTVRAYATNSQGTNYTGPLAVTTLAAPPSFTGTYSQEFDNFTGTLPAGWSIASSAATYGGLWGSGSTAGTRGGVADPGVLGYQHTSTSGIFTTTLTLKNNTGSTLTALNVAYKGRVERVDQTRTPAWEVKFNGGDAITALAYSTESGADQTKLTALSGLSIPNGTTFTISWSSDRGTNSGTSRQIGISDVIVSTSPIVVGGYDSWALTHADGAGKTADNDNDGIINLIEYATGSDPKVSNGNPAVITGNTTVTFPKGADAVTNGDVTYKIQTSATMAAGSWVDVTPTTNTATQISYTFPAGPVKYFARLVVE